TWVGRGFSVVPCSRTDKGALVAGFGKDATAEELAKFTDQEQVRAWWSGRFRRAHVGLLTGRCADGRGLVVVDLDMPKPDTTPPVGRWQGCYGGTDVLELLAREAGADWPETYTVMTPGGGLHLYFQQPADGPLIGCATGEGPTPPHIGPMVDVRGVGGYVIAAGSYSTAQGRVYERASAPEVRPQPLPGWLLELLRPSAPPAAPPRPPAPVCLYAPGGRPASRAERYAAAALDGAADDIAQAVEGERNRRLFAAARKLGELHEIAPEVLSEAAVRAQLLSAALAVGLRERASLASIESGWTKGIANPTMPRALLGGAA
ncbi:bifunctional DNA primase/polymerase, partial [Streptomyces sp. NPDC060011]